MSGRFDDFHSMIGEFMRESGFTTTYYSVGEAIPNDAAGTISSITTEIPVQCIKMELPRPTNGVTSKAGTQIETSDQLLYIRPTDKADKFADAVLANPTGDYILINNARWKIVTVKEYNSSAEDNILYEMYIRK